jgi:diguanylate cyclase (GGDEF)-like protein
MQKRSNIEQFHTYLNTVLTELLENQVKTRSFITGVQQYKNKVLDKNSIQLAEDSLRDQQALSKSNDQLIKLGALNWERSIKQIKNLLVKCDYLVRDLHKALIDRELYEHQGRVLQGIILSHEKIENWEEFVQSILCEFHSIFTFNFFSIAFNSYEGIDLYLYYMGEFSTEDMVEAKKILSANMTSKLKQTKKLKIKEYRVLDHKLTGIDIKQMHSVTIDVDGKLDNLGGLLEMGYFSSIPLGIDEKSIIRSILSVMVMVIGSSRTLKKTLTELDFHAKQDPLTSVFNRRYFNDFLEKEIERSKRYNHEFCILMLDLDNFKGINDSYGHLLGDDVLIDVARVLKQKTRLGDTVTRLGGDEFAIILPETDSTGAHHVAEEIKKAISKHSFSSEHNFQMTISIGVISFPTQGVSVKELLSNVDLALYKAKAKGRNIVCDYKPRVGE